MGNMGGGILAKVCHSFLHWCLWNICSELYELHILFSLLKPEQSHLDFCSWKSISVDKAGILSISDVLRLSCHIERMGKFKIWTSNRTGTIYYLMQVLLVALLVLLLLGAGRENVGTIFSPPCDCLHWRYAALMLSELVLNTSADKVLLLSCTMPHNSGNSPQLQTWLTWNSRSFRTVSPYRNGYLKSFPQDWISWIVIFSWLLDLLPAHVLPTKHPHPTPKSLNIAPLPSWLKRGASPKRLIHYGSATRRSARSLSGVPTQLTLQIQGDASDLLLFAFAPLPLTDSIPNCLIMHMYKWGEGEKQSRNLLLRMY